MRGRTEFRRVAPLLRLLLWLFLSLDGHRFEVRPRSNFLGLRVLREEGIGAGRVPIWRDMPEDLAAVVRIIHMAADGRALAGDADLDGAPVCSYVTAYLRGRVIPSRGRRGVIFFLALVAHACAISAHRREGRFMGATWAMASARAL